MLLENEDVFCKGSARTCLGVCEDLNCSAAWLLVQQVSGGGYGCYSLGHEHVACNLFFSSTV